MVAPLYKFETSLVKSEGRPRNFEYSDQLFVVGGGKCPFNIEVAEDDVLLVGVGVLHT